MNERIALGLCIGILTAGAARAELENYFDCRMKEGTSRAELVAFKNAYESAAAEEGMKDYNLKLLFPVYSDQYGPDRFFWYGSFRDFAHLQVVSDWFNGSEWPARFSEHMECSSSSLWRADD